MDVALQQLRREWISKGDQNSAQKYANALLRINDLDYYEDVAEAGDIEIQSLLPILRAGFLQYFIDEHGNAVTKYLNVYSYNIPIATITVSNYQRFLQAKRWLNKFYSQFTFLLPPSQIKLNNIANEKYFFLREFHNLFSSQRKLQLDDHPCFDLVEGEIKPVDLWSPGEWRGQQRLIISDDYVSDEEGGTWNQDLFKQIFYDDLPLFAKPAEMVGAPQYLIANEVTRGIHRYEDGTGWRNYYSPIAIIYVGYLINYLLDNIWSWTDKVYTYVCDNQCVESFGRYEVPCSLFHQEVEQGPYQQVRCPECNQRTEPNLLRPAQIITNDSSYPVPEHLNDAYSFLQIFFDYIIHGNIYSVLGGTDLSVSLVEISYEPLRD